MSDGFQRKLAAILSADAAGYSRLMGDDEAATVRTVTDYLGLMTAMVREHGGRVIDTPGDNILAEFPSVVGAVECALDIQAALKVRNEALPEHRRMAFRIGINLGDVIVEGDRLYGDGVNIAARLESLAEPGGICVSGTVYEHIRNKLTLWNEYMGRHRVKNIADAVEVYRLGLDPAPPGPRLPVRTRRIMTRLVPAAAALVLVGWLVVAGRDALVDRAMVDGAPAGAADPTPVPSVAVLAFENMSDDPDQEYFSDGITEDLITDLSRVPGLMVLARTTTFAYKGRAVNLTEVGRELGVTHVVEGSVRRADDRVRITAQLIDARTGGHLWAERYDRPLDDIFAVQDEVVAEIARALEVTLTADDRASLPARPSNVETHDLVMRGWWHYHQYTREDNERARDLFLQALMEDPRLPSALTGVGFTWYEEWAQLWTQDPGVLEEARLTAVASLDMDETLPGAHTLLSHVYLWTGEHDAALEAQSRALELAPHDANAYRDLGEVLLFAGYPEEAIPLLEEGMRLNPRYGVHFPLVMGLAYATMEDYAGALPHLNEALQLNPTSTSALLALAGCHEGLGQRDEAESYVARALALNPYITAEGLRYRLPFRDPATTDRLVSALQEAGLP